MRAVFLRSCVAKKGHMQKIFWGYGQLPIREIPLFPHEIQGLERLRQVAALLGPGYHDR